MAAHMHIRTFDLRLFHRDSSRNVFRHLPIARLFILQLNFSDGQVRDLLEEMGVYLEGHLAILDNVSITDSC